MGSEYFWFLDIFVAAVAAATLYRGAKRGAVAVLISSVAAIVAFIVAFLSSGFVSEQIYDAFVRERIEDYMEERLGEAVDFEVIKGLSQVDMMKTKAGDVSLADIKVDYDERKNAVIDLSKLDLSETGIENADLSGFGIGKDFDWTLVKAGHLTVSESDMQKYGIGNIVLAHIISSNLTSGNFFTALDDIGDKLGETVSPSLRNMGSDLTSGSRDAIFKFTVSMITATEGTFGDRIMKDIIEPTVMLPLRAGVFCIIFGIVLLILNIIASLSKIINKVPIVSSVNGVLGAVLGLLEGVVIILLVCMVFRLLIALCGDSLVFINETTINKSFIFRHLYAIDPLSLIGLSG